MGRVIDIYGGKDPRDLPRYSTAEAAHYLRLPRATLKTWVHGRVDSNGHRAEAVIKLPTDSQLLSLQNLVEAHVLGAIRRHHGVSLQRVRKALRFVERRMHLPRPLITAKFQTNGMDLFVDELGKLINASSAGQTEMEGALRASLARVEHDADGLASRLCPFVRGEGKEPKVILVDPRLAFGRPVVANTGVPVSIIVGRYRAGEDVSAIAKGLRHLRTTDSRCHQERDPSGCLNLDVLRRQVPRGENRGRRAPRGGPGRRSPR